MDVDGKKIAPTYFLLSRFHEVDADAGADADAFFSNSQERFETNKKSVGVRVV